MTVIVVTVIVVTVIVVTVIVMPYQPCDLDEFDESAPIANLALESVSLLHLTEMFES